MRLANILAIFLLLFAVSVSADVNVERINYHGWVDSYRVTAGRYSLVVVPEIGGRVMEYSVDGENVIWQNPDEFGRTYPMAAGVWYNYGGYKAWITAKGSWPWPPDPMIDFGKANVQVVQSPGKAPVLRVTGAPSLNTGVMYVKDITLDESGEVTLTQRLRNISKKTVAYSIWAVTQVDAPCFVAFPIAKKSRFSGGVDFQEGTSPQSRQIQVKDGICITDYMGEMGKVGSDSNGPWMVWLKGDLAYVKLFDPMKEHAAYPHGGCSAEVYTSDKALSYAEMELLGPVVKIKPGCQSESVEHWKLMKLSAPVKDVEGVLPAVKSLGLE